MRDFLNVLGGIIIVIAVLGGIGLFVLLDETPLAPEVRLGIAIGVCLECVITAAVLLGMAEGLRLLDIIAARGKTEAVGTGAVVMPTQTGVRRVPSLKEVLNGPDDEKQKDDRAAGGVYQDEKGDSVWPKR